MVAPYFPQTYGLTLLLMCASVAPPATAQDEEAQTVSIEPHVIIVEEGYDVTIACTTNLPGPPDLLWYSGEEPQQDQLLPEPPSGSAPMTSPGLWANKTTGVLTVRGASLAWGGPYLCQAGDGSGLNANATLKVYVMPSYLTEGMVVLAINAALISFFVACALHSYILRRRAKAKSPNGSKKPEVEAGGIEIIRISKREIEF